ncbi:heparan-alpha-glucosaminide N-acetyltransferase domain-containing protein [Acinetobacter baumannii]
MSLEKNIERLQSIDALRGLVIIIMLLDHVRETFYLHKQVTDPMDVTVTEPALFGSRLLAHICAPVFVLLTGISAFLFQSKKQDLQQTRAFLLKRGLFLIVLELTLVNFAWTATFPPEVIYLQVIWAIGISMVVLACCVSLPLPVLAGVALMIIFGHNLLDSVHFSQGILQNIWFVLHERGWIEIAGIKLRTSYPVLPWIGVILLGYVLGQFFSSKYSAKRRSRALLSLGLVSIGLFVLLRFINVYGDQPWQHFESLQLSLMSFFNLTKYPPSLLFILLNVGIGLLVLVAFERMQQYSFLKPLVVFGSVPMFFYLLHLYVLKLMYVLALSVWGANYGNYLSVNHVWMLWLITIVLSFALYPAVKWLSKFKHQNKHISILKYF